MNSCSFLPSLSYSVMRIIGGLASLKSIWLFVSDLGAHGEAVNNLSVQTFVGNSVFGTATTELHTVSDCLLHAPNIVTVSCRKLSPSSQFFRSFLSLLSVSTCTVVTSVVAIVVSVVYSFYCFVCFCYVVVVVLFSCLYRSNYSCCVELNQTWLSNYLFSC